MKLGIRAKLILVSVGVVAFTTLAADLYLTFELDAELSERVRSELRVRLGIVEAGLAREQAPLDDLVRWDAVADGLGSRAEARLTIIASDDRVVGDSEVALVDLPDLEPHGGRPEVVAARRDGRGSAVRLSATLGTRMMYVAAPLLSSSSRPYPVVRLAKPLTEVDAALARMHRLVAFAAGIAMLLASVMSSLAGHLLSRSVRSMTRAARRMAAGDLELRTRAASRDEVGELGRALDELAQNLGEALRALRDERDVLGGVLEGMREGVLLLDADGSVALANRALLAMLDITEPKGKRPLEIARSAALERVLAQAAERQEASTAEMDVSDGRNTRLLVRAAPLAETAGSVLAVFVDVTELRRLENMRRDFVANVSHELRTPIAALRSAAETLTTMGTENPVAGEFLAIIERNAERLGRLVEDLLDLSSIESRVLRLHLESVPLAASCSELVSSFRPSADARHVTLECAVGAEVGAVRADRRALEQILSNLLDNAVKYGREGGQVRLIAAVKAGAVEISVCDDGPGIERHHLPRLFERFYRVDAGRSRELGGTGLGLAIVKHLADSMNGQVGVESDPGHGSTFTVRLPPA